MANHYLPTDQAIRKCIEGVKEEPYRYGFMYQLLIAGRISEVCGEYAPRGADAFEVEFDLNGEKIPAVLFAVKTAKRRGKLRACAVPLDPSYEPWAGPLLKYFRETDEDYPFMYGPTFKTSTTYAQRVAKRAYEGLEWPMISYSHPKEYEAVPSPCPRCKLELNEKCPICGGSGFYHKRLKIPDRWKYVTSHVLRKRRTLTLRIFYGFDGFDLSAFGGWTEKSQVDTLPGALKHYLHIDIQEAREAVGLLQDMAKTYFHKLLKPVP